VTSRLLPEELDHYPVIDGRYLLDAGPSARGWHRAATGLTCTQLLAYTDELMLNLPEAGVLVRGSLIHLGLAHYFRRLQAIQERADPDLFLPPVAAVRVFAELQDARPVSLYREKGTPSKHPASVPYAAHVEEAIASVEAMHRWFQAAQWNVLAVERQVHADVPTHDGGTALFSQRLDLVLSDKAGTVFVVDHKSRGRKDPRTQRAYARSGQFQGFHTFGADLWRERWGGVYIFFVTLGKTVTIERHAPPVYPNRIHGFPATIRWSEHLQAEARRLHPDPWNRPKVGLDNGACEHRFGACPAAALCDHGRAQLDAWEAMQPESGEE
jgi:hypothetical protein